MKVEQIYTGCLSQGAYYIQSKDEAIIIDPLREVKPYIERAERDKVKIKYILETHFHADFVSGHLTLSEKTGATIVFGPSAKPSFPSYIAKDGDFFSIGDVKIKAVHTPGHTMESTTFLLFDENGKEHAIFTGDTLFLGDVGRPDLAQKVADMTQEDLAGILYDSLRNKIMPLPNDVLVYPAHGAGSACGKNMMKETVDSLGNQKETNYALKESLSKEDFVKELTDGLLPPPKYFPLNVKMNKEGYESIENVLNESLKGLTPEEFETIADDTHALILDVRKPSEYAEAHIPKSIFIGLDGSFAPWVGDLIIDVKQPILLVTPKGREEEAITRLSRVGFDNVLGYLKDGFQAWDISGKEKDFVKSISAQELEKEFDKAKINLFDVRKKSEFESEHLLDAKNTPLSNINAHLSEFPKEKPFALHCAGGYRSMIASSILKARGFHNLVDVDGGFKALSETSLPKSNFICSSTKN